MTILLIVLSLTTAIVNIVANYRNQVNLIYVSKPLTMVWIILLAVLTDGADTNYQWWIVAGLLFSLAGDVFLMLPKDRFIEGLGSFLIAHLCYIVGFCQLTGFGGSPSNLIIWLVPAVIVYQRLAPHLGKIKPAVILYIAAIAVMAWQGTEMGLLVSGNRGWWAIAGVSLFVISDSVLAINRFRQQFHAAQGIVLGTYFPAQLCLALTI